MTATASPADRPQLSKAAVVERALKLADADGLDALTIRKLAQDLGVTPMALYWHFRSKVELLDGLAERVWSEIDANVDPAAPWPAQLRGMLESLIDVLRAHPSAPWLLSEYKGTNEHGLRATEAALGVLRDGAGFGPDEASEIARLALWTGIMLVLSENGFEPGKSQAERDEENRVKMVRLSTLPPALFPRVVEHAKELTDCGSSDLHFKLGVDIYIAGVEAAAPVKVALSSLPAAGDHQAGFVGGHDGLGAVAQAELAEHAAHVRLHGFLGDHEPGGYLGVGQAFGDEAQHLGFPRRQAVQRHGRVTRLKAGELADQPGGDGRGEQRLAGRDDADRVEKPLGGHVLEQEAAGSGP
jgi:TetR/AcrR family transcriptional regulator, tetracycline repressor protein